MTSSDNPDLNVRGAVSRLRDDDASVMRAMGLTTYPGEPELDRHAYHYGVQLARADAPFAALIFAALYRADSTNARILRAAFPVITQTGQARYEAPGGILPGEVGE